MNKQDSYLTLPNELFETVVRRFKNSVMKTFRETRADAPDRNFVDRMFLKEWEVEVDKAFRNPQTVRDIETAHRIGEPVSKLIEMLVEANGPFLAKSKNQYLQSSKKLNQKRIAFKCIVHLFAFRRAAHIANGSKNITFNIVHTLPRSVEQFTLGTKPVSQLEDTRLAPAAWESAQSVLAALFITLRDKGYMPKIPSQRLIKALFTNTNSIDDYLRPYRQDGVELFKKIPASDFAAFSSIKQNKKSPRKNQSSS